MDLIQWVDTQDRTNALLRGILEIIHPKHFVFNLWGNWTACDGLVWFQSQMESPGFLSSSQPTYSSFAGLGAESGADFSILPSLPSFYFSWVWR